MRLCLLSSQGLDAGHCLYTATQFRKIVPCMDVHLCCHPSSLDGVNALVTVYKMCRLEADRAEPD